MGAIQRLGYAMLCYAMLTAASHLVARTIKHEAVLPFPSKPSEHEQRQILLLQNKRHKSF